MFIVTGLFMFGCFVADGELLWVESSVNGVSYWSGLACTGVLCRIAVFVILFQCIKRPIRLNKAYPLSRDPVQIYCALGMKGVRLRNACVMFVCLNADLC